MSKIYGVFEREENKEWYQDNGRRVMLGSDNKLDCEIIVGSAKKSEKFVDVIVTRDNNDFNATVKVHGEREFMLRAVKDNDIVMVKSLVRELKDWIEYCDYEDIIQVLDEMKGLKATLCAYLEDISRMEE